MDGAGFLKYPREEIDAPEPSPDFASDVSHETITFLGKNLLCLKKTLFTHMGQRKPFRYQD